MFRNGHRLAHGQGGEFGGEGVPGLLGIDGQTAVQAHGDVEGVPQLTAELGGDEQAALGVDAVLVRAGGAHHSRSPLFHHFPPSGQW